MIQVIWDSLKNSTVSGIKNWDIMDVHSPHLWLNGALVDFTCNKKCYYEAF